MGGGLAVLTCIPEMMRAMGDIPTDCKTLSATAWRWYQ